MNKVLQSLQLYFSVLQFFIRFLNSFEFWKAFTSLRNDGQIHFIASIRWTVLLALGNKTPSLFLRLYAFVFSTKIFSIIHELVSLWCSAFSSIVVAEWPLLFFFPSFVFLWVKCAPTMLWLLHCPWHQLPSRC